MIARCFPPTLLALALAACSGDGDEPTATGPTDPGTSDTSVTTSEMVFPDPGPLEVGFSRLRIPAPVGIGTTGFGGIGVSGELTPFQEIYPGTNGIHGHPDFRVTVLSRGEGHTVILLRTDTIGIFQQLRQSIVLELEARTGRRDLDDALIIGATHTHSGPGRVIEVGGPFELIADRFFPEFYDRMVDQMADVVEEALNDLKPGRIGLVFADGADSIKDRRCEDGLDYVNGTIPVLAVEREGELAGLVMAHGIHGTVHGIEELMLSQDVSGGIEAAIPEVYGAPLHVQMHNSWGADISPTSSNGPEEQPGADLISGMKTIASIGQVVADDVVTALLDVEWIEEPEIWTQTLRTPIDRQAIGYEEGVFPYEYGGVYCTATGDCDPTTREEGLDRSCLEFSEEFPAPNQTTFTVGQVGPLHLITFPGEPGTLLAEAVLEGLDTWLDSPVMFIGYGQDYLGYSILEEDWWQGGYEASGALWGPRQGEYLVGEAVSAMGEALGEVEPKERPVANEPFGGGTYDAYQPATSVDRGTVLVQPVDAGVTDLIEATVAGDDPWLGAPLAVLEQADGTPVLRADGTPLDSDHPAFRVVLEVDPPWTQEASERTFRWTFQLPAQHPIPGSMPSLSGAYRLSVSGADGQPLATTESFTITP